ncbi:pyridoxamine 5'-phosphate oxidase family protein [Roseomonas sp. USHLN139]|uniref:pyridoxamine 5'-phosphate oxidase family protein n=1 Tax=Roseomonas sp. USHLN139 TaxID=3081298 RepID=UPI003B016F57
MAYSFLDTYATPSVQAAQAAMGADHLWRGGGRDRVFDRLDEDVAAFIAERDSFYMASTAENGWPYVQHRGGPAGFLKVIDPVTLAFADYRGNRQYISTGNLAADDRVALILVDYPRRARLKLLAHATMVPLGSDPALEEAVRDPGYRGQAERVFRLRLQAYDWNCPQHITPRFTAEQVNAGLAPLRARLAELEAENAALRAAAASAQASQ